MKEFKEFRSSRMKRLQERRHRSQLGAAEPQHSTTPITPPPQLLHHSITPPLHYFADSCGVAQEPEAVNNPPSGNPIPK
jgi:hypothetical protein